MQTWFPFPLVMNPTARREGIPSSPAPPPTSFSFPVCVLLENSLPFPCLQAGGKCLALQAAVPPFLPSCLCAVSSCLPTYLLPVPSYYPSGGGERRGRLYACYPHLHGCWEDYISVGGGLHIVHAGSHYPFCPSLPRRDREAATPATPDPIHLVYCLPGGPFLPCDPLPVHLLPPSAPLPVCRVEDCVPTHPITHCRSIVPDQAFPFPYPLNTFRGVYC